MRRSFSRGRRPLAKDEPGLIAHAMPRLLAEHDDDNTALQPTFPMSPKSRRRLRAQLFGLDTIIQNEGDRTSSALPVDRCRALAGGHSPQCSVDEQNVKAIALLRELNKTASVVDSIELAPPAEQSTSVSPSSSTERSLSRRRSSYKPGEATRPKSSHTTSATHHVDPKIPSVPKLHEHRDHLDTPARPRMQRAVTPGEFDNVSLGTHELGSLRITNDHAPTSPPYLSKDLSASTMVKQNRAPDYFAGMQPGPPAFASTEHELANEADQSQTLVKKDDVVTATNSEGDSPFSSSSNEGDGLQASENKRSSKRGSVLVGHRRHAQQRANTIGFNYERGNSPYSVSSLESADEARTGLGGNISSNTLNVSSFAHAPLSPLSTVSDVHSQPLYEKPSNASANISTHSPVPSNALLSLDGSSNDSAYGSRASIEVADDDRSRGRYNENDNIVRPDSPTSVYSVQDDTASVIVHNRHPPDDNTHLELPAPQTLKSSGSFLSESSRDSNAGPRPPTSSGSAQASSRQSRSPTRPNKLQKRQPSPKKPTPADDIVVQRHQAPVAGVPDPSSALLSAHATRMDNNPGMDHLTETHSPVAKRSVSAESATIPPASLLFRFPSPTPSLEVDARDQKGFFRSMSRSRKKTVSHAKEKPAPILITRDDLGDVLGVLGASPYDCASPPRTRTTSAQQKLNKQPVLHPHQISGSGIGTTRGMSAEDAAAMAMQWSRDRVAGPAELGIHNARRQRPSTSLSPQRRTEKARAAQPPPSPFPSVDGETTFHRQGRPRSPQRHPLEPETSHSRSIAATMPALATEEHPLQQEMNATSIPAVEAKDSTTATQGQSVPATNPVPSTQTPPISGIATPASLPAPATTTTTTAPPQQIQQPLPKPTIKPSPAPNVYLPPASWACPPPPNAPRPAQPSTKRPTTSKSSSWKPWKKPEPATPAIMPFQPLVLNLPTPTPSRSPSPLPLSVDATAAAPPAQTPSSLPIPAKAPTSDTQTPPPPPPHGIPLPSKLSKPATTTSALPRPPSRAHSFLKRPYSSRKSKKRPALPEVPPQLPALSLDFGAGFEGLEDGAWVEYGGGEEEEEEEEVEMGEKRDEDVDEDAHGNGNGVEDEWVGRSRLELVEDVLED